MVLTLAVLAATVSAPAGAQQALTTRQMTALKPSQADKVVPRDLLSVFGPVGEISSGMFVRLHGDRQFGLVRLGSTAYR